MDILREIKKRNCKMPLPPPTKRRSRHGDRATPHAARRPRHHISRGDRAAALQAHTQRRCQPPASPSPALRLPKPLHVLITDALEVTKNNSRLHLLVAVNYSGQKDIVQACQSMSLKVKEGVVKPEDIYEFLIEDKLETSCTDFPCPDLLIARRPEIGFKYNEEVVLDLIEDPPELLQCKILPVKKF
ncbi:Alkyl transferase [Forsythia ovata]|uniref:Alkyl transferase n=1 Tax=Forsythia ovata TaxID=205694 RepID=A0ABD1WEM6_9LAMI